MLACSCDRLLESGKWGRKGETAKLQDTWIRVPEAPCLYVSTIRQNFVLWNGAAVL